MTPILREKIAGALYGLLIGDALGCSVEGFSRERINKDFGAIDEMLDGQDRWRPAGLHSDDGQQALALCDAVLRSPASPTLNFANLLVELRSAGPSGFRRFGYHRGTGANFRSTVMALKTAQPLRAENVYVGSKETAGNGAAMRVAPLALFYRDDDERLLDELISTARVTHSDARGIAAAAAVAWVVKSCLATDLPPKQWPNAPFLHFVRRCEKKCDALFSTSAQSDDFSRVLAVVLKNNDLPFDDLIDVIEREASACTESRVRAGVGFAVASVVLSLAIFFRASSFEEALVDVIACGDDTDTTAAMVGQMCGARFGRNAIPKKWMDALAARASLDERVLALQMRWPSFEPAFSVVDLEAKWCEAYFAGSPAEKSTPLSTSKSQSSEQIAPGASHSPAYSPKEEKEKEKEKPVDKNVEPLADVSSLPIPSSTTYEDERMKEDASFSFRQAHDDDGLQNEETTYDEEDEELPFWMNNDEDGATNTVGGPQAIGAEDSSLVEKRSEPDENIVSNRDSSSSNPGRQEDRHAHAAPKVAQGIASGDSSAAASSEPGTAQLSMFDAPSSSVTSVDKLAVESEPKPASKPLNVSESVVEEEEEKIEKVEEKAATGDHQMGEDTSANIKIVLEKGDITKVIADAIVNAANTSLLGGGGVDGAIHRAGGPAILDECKDIRARQGGCKTGNAVITTAGNLSANKVIHTVGPRWRGGDQGEPTLLKNAYVNSLDLARENRLRRVAFPSISTGVYRYPIEQAARLALQAVSSYLREYPDDFDEVRFVLFETPDLWVYEKALADVVSWD
ncbi:MAG: O-acetyl-ADP-ribose deacetylase [Deltaproteobacteria bacterium]|nr:O-acetyl-ADP-ribose deacetylase [Deltaproteobacteria bacterium]